MNTNRTSNSSSIPGVLRYPAFILVLAVSLSACDSGSKRANQEPDPPVNTISATEGPTLTAAPNANTPLTAIVDMTTDAPAQASLTVSDGTESFSVDFPGLNTEHSLPVLGLKPNTDYSVTVTISDEAGTPKDLQTLNVITPALPELFPDVTVVTTDPVLMEPGFTMLDKIGRGRGADPSLTQYSIILDGDGDVVWFSELGGNPNILTDDGNIMFREDRHVMTMDMLGNVLTDVVMQDPGEALHHELFPTANGTLLSLSFEEVTVDNYPADLEDPEPRRTADIRDEPVVEFDPETGELINVWRMVDILDTSRVNYSSFAESPNGLDWIHGNAALYDPRDDSIIASFRHQDAVIKFDYATGALKWILAPHANWSEAFQPYLLTPQGANFDWQYHQHAPMITAAGNLLLYDNGNYRASPYTEETALASEEAYTRAVIFDIDETNMTVEQVWEYGEFHSPRLNTEFIGDADEMLMTGNVLITFGGTGYMDGVEVGDLGYGQIVARVVEVTKTDPAEVVFEVMLSDPELWVSVFRSERIASLYPPGVTVTAQ